MIDSDKIRLMTDIEMRQRKQGRENYIATHYYAYDYISLQVIKTVIGVTLAYAIGVGFWVLVNIEAFLEENKVSEVFLLVRDFIVLYVAILLLTTLICSLLYASRYWNARKTMGGYVDSLRKLNQHYVNDSKRRR